MGSPSTLLLGGLLMRRRLSIGWVILVAAVPVLLAMGSSGSGPISDTIPRPEDNFSADLVDRQGVTTRVEYLSCAGKTFLPLERGEGTLMVPFAKVTRLSVGSDAGTRVTVRVEVEGGRSLEGSLPRTLLCTGATEYGNYEIQFQGLHEVVLVRP
jgi:hypothetical protein